MNEKRPLGAVMKSMINYFAGDIKRINHFLKVYGLAKSIGEIEGLDERTQEILEITALVHDIGIKLSEQKYQSSSGKWQQIEGPGEAKKMLTNLGYEEDNIERVCFLIAHHHTYHGVEGLDYQILIEADFLVNAYEESLSPEAIQKGKKLFKTNTGLMYMQNLYQDKIQVGE